MSVEFGPAGRPLFGAALRSRILAQGHFLCQRQTKQPHSQACKVVNR